MNICRFCAVQSPVLNLTSGGSVPAGDRSAWVQGLLPLEYRGTAPNIWGFHRSLAIMRYGNQLIMRQQAADIEQMPHDKIANKPSVPGCFVGGVVHTGDIASIKPDSWHRKHTKPARTAASQKLRRKPEIAQPLIWNASALSTLMDSFRYFPVCCQLYSSACGQLRCGLFFIGNLHTTILG